MSKLAQFILPIALKIKWLTPNIITLSSFFLYVLGCLFIFIDTPFHLYYTALFLPIAYIGDCLDGQVARSKNLSSSLGDYLDKVLDVFKIYILTISLAYERYLNSHDVTYIFLGFTACFFFNFRFYIMLETVFSQCNRDPGYLIKSAQRKQKLSEEISRKYKNLNTTFIGKIKLFWLKNKIIFWVDEAEFVIFTSVAILFNKIEIVLWILAISQTSIAFWRLFERGYQINKKQSALLNPLRK